MQVCRRCTLYYIIESCTFHVSVAKSIVNLHAFYIHLNHTIRYINIQILTFQPQLAHTWYAECRKADCICLMQVKQHFSSSAFDLQRLQSFMHSFLDASLEFKLFHVLFMVANDHPEGLASCKLIIRICRPLANDNPENSRFLCKIWFKSKYLQTMQVKLAQGSGFSSYFFLFSSHLDHLKSFLVIILSFFETKIV